MDPSPLKIIPVLENIVVLPTAADKANLWRAKFTAEAEKNGYSTKIRRGGQSSEFRKNYRGRTEILFSQDQNHLLASFSYKAPFYCKFILWASFISFFVFFLIEVVLSSMAELYHFAYSGWSLVVSLSSLCMIPIFGLTFVFLIAKYDSERSSLLPDQRLELIGIAQAIRIAEDSSLISEANYLNKPGFLPDIYNDIGIIYNPPNIDRWKGKFLDLVKENGYLSKDQYFFNYLQLLKANRTFEVGFKWDPNALLIHFHFHRHFYYFATSLGLLSVLPVSLALFYSLDHSLLFLIISIVLFASYAAFRIWYGLSVERTAPEYVADLKNLASKAAELC